MEPRFSGNASLGSALRRATLCALALSLCGLAPAANDGAERLRPWLAAQGWVRDTPGPVLSLGTPGAFDDMHIFAPCVALEDGQYRMWYCGSRGSVGQRVFRVGLAVSRDGRNFQKIADNPV